MSLAVIGAGAALTLWAAHYRLRAVQQPQLNFDPSALNQHLVGALEQLQQPYRPTPWLYNTHLQLLWLLLKEAVPSDTHDRSCVLSMSAKRHLINGPVQPKPDSRAEAHALDRGAARRVSD